MTTPDMQNGPAAQQARPDATATTRQVDDAPDNTRSSRG